MVSVRSLGTFFIIFSLLIFFIPSLFLSPSSFAPPASSHSPRPLPHSHSSAGRQVFAISSGHAESEHEHKSAPGNSYKRNSLDDKKYTVKSKDSEIQARGVKKDYDRRLKRQLLSLVRGTNSAKEKNRNLEETLDEDDEKDESQKEINRMENADVGLNSSHRSSAWDDTPEPEPDLMWYDDVAVDLTRPLEFPDDPNPDVEGKRKHAERLIRARARGAFPSFDMLEVAAIWDAKVGCEAFRRKHADLIAEYRGGGWVSSKFFQHPPRDEGDCSSFKLDHITILVDSSSPLSEASTSHFACKCGLTCTLVSSSNISSGDLGSVDAKVSAQIPFQQAARREAGDPLRVYISLNGAKMSAVEKKMMGVDIFVGQDVEADLQISFARSGRNVHRNRNISEAKRRDKVLYHRAAKYKVAHHQMVRTVLQRSSVHSFGEFFNNMRGQDEQTLYPHCRPLHRKHFFAGQPRKSLGQTNQLEEEEDSDIAPFSHCVQSHYMFSLVFEDEETAAGAGAVVSEKFFAALESGTVPVYFGRPHVFDYAPPDSFLYGNQLSPLALSKKIQSFSRSHFQYLGLHAWRRCGVFGHYKRSIVYSLDRLPCRLCEEISRRGGEKTS